MILGLLWDGNIHIQTALMYTHPYTSPGTLQIHVGDAQMPTIEKSNAGTHHSMVLLACSCFTAFSTRISLLRWRGQPRSLPTSFRLFTSVGAVLSFARAFTWLRELW